MVSLEAIHNKITMLGGVKQNPSCKGDDFLKAKESLTFELEKRFENSIPTLYIDTIQFFGPFSFIKSIKIECRDLNPVVDKN